MFTSSLFKSGLKCMGAATAVSTTMGYSSDCKSRSSPLTEMKDKVVLVTGASAGIGSSIAWRFAEEGSKVIIAGRRREKLNELKADILKDYPASKIHVQILDVRDVEACMALPEQLPADFKDVAVLVNNAGLALGVSTVDTNDLGQAENMLATNVLGLMAMCRAFAPGMKERKEGHIINIGSIAGHFAYGTGSAYNASKFAVTGFTAAARHDLLNSPVKITHVSPGLVGNTEFSNVRFTGDKEADAKAAKVYQDIVALHPDDIADDVFYVATRPAHVQTCELMTMCTNQAGPKDVARVGGALGK